MFPFRSWSSTQRLTVDSSRRMARGDKASSSLSSSAASAIQPKTSRKSTLPTGVEGTTIQIDRTSHIYRIVVYASYRCIHIYIYAHLTYLYGISRIGLPTIKVNKSFLHHVFIDITGYHQLRAAEGGGQGQVVVLRLGPRHEKREEDPEHVQEEGRGHEHVAQPTPKGAPTFYKTSKIS